MDDGGFRLEGIVEAAIGGSAGHELRDALRALGAHRPRIEAALFPDEPHEEHRRQSPRIRLLLHQWADCIDEGLRLICGDFRRCSNAVLHVVAVRRNRTEQQRKSEPERRDLRRREARRKFIGIYGKFLGISCGRTRRTPSQTITREKAPMACNRSSIARNAFLFMDISACEPNMYEHSKKAPSGAICRR